MPVLLFSQYPRYCKYFPSTESLLSLPFLLPPSSPTRISGLARPVEAKSSTQGIKESAKIFHSEKPNWCPVSAQLPQPPLVSTSRQHTLIKRFSLNYSHVPHDDVQVNNGLRIGPHTGLWSHKTVIELKNPYHPLTLSTLQPKTLVLCLWWCWCKPTDCTATCIKAKHSYVQYIIPCSWFVCLLYYPFASLFHSALFLLIKKCLL